MKPLSRLLLLVAALALAVTFVAPLWKMMGIV